MAIATYAWWPFGDVQIARWNAGVLGGFSDPVNCKNIDIKPASDKKQQTSYKKATMGFAIRTSFLPKPPEFSVEFDEGDRDLFAAALLGTASTFAQMSATAQSATVALVLDKWVPIVKGIYNISAVSIPSLVLGTDFEFKANLGLIKAKTAGAAGSKTVTYSKGAIAGDVIAGGTLRSIDLSFLMDVTNNSDGQNGILVIPKVTVSASDAFKFVSGDFQSYKFAGDIVDAGTGENLYTLYPANAYS